MGNDDNDVLMYLILKGSDPIRADSVAELMAGSKLGQGFVPGKYFQIENFSFGFELKDDEGDEKQQAGASGEKRSFPRWRAIKPGEVKPTKLYRAVPDELTFTRLIDSASPVLLQHCLKSEKFEKAAILKRARTNTGNLSGLLRLEFEKVWIKSIQWEDGDAVRETCKLQFGKLNVTLLKRKPDGTIASSWPCQWDGSDAAT